jgi:hypothetical protein
MINEKDSELIRELASVVGKSSEQVVSSYSEWFVYSSLGWVAVGVAICVLAVVLEFGADSDLEEISKLLIRAAIAFFGCIFIFVNLPDLLSPQAAAIHQIITDIRGH